MSRKNSRSSASRTQTQPATPSISSLKIDVMLWNKEVADMTGWKGREDMLENAQTMLAQAKARLDAAIATAQTTAQA